MKHKHAETAKDIRSSTPVPTEDSDVDSLATANSKLSLTHTTSSNTSSTSSGSSHHPSSKFHSILHSSKHNKKHHSLPTPWVFVQPTNPVALAEYAITNLISYPSQLDIDTIKNEFFPRLYWSEYRHRTNAREIDLNGLADLVVFLRNRYRSIRIRFKSSLVDLDGTATMKTAAVGLTYDILAIPHHAPKNEAVEHEKKMQVMSIVKILDGRLAQNDLVLETSEVQETGNKELSCVIM